MLVRLTKYIRLLLVYLHHVYIHNIILSITFEGISRVVTLLRITFEGTVPSYIMKVDYIKINHLYNHMSIDDKSVDARARISNVDF